MLWSLPTNRNTSLSNFWSAVMVLWCFCLSRIHEGLRTALVHLIKFIYCRRLDPSVTRVVHFRLQSLISCKLCSLWRDRALPIMNQIRRARSLTLRQIVAVLHTAVALFQDGSALTIFGLPCLVWVLSSLLHLQLLLQLGLLLSLQEPRLLVLDQPLVPHLFSSLGFCEHGSFSTAYLRRDNVMLIVKFDDFDWPCFCRFLCWD